MSTAAAVVLEQEIRFLERIAAAARAGAGWDGVGDALTGHDARVRAALSRPPTRREAATLAPLVSRLIAVHDEIARSAEGAREAYAERLCAARIGHTARARYRAASVL